MEKAKQNTDQVIKIQANVRGFLQRKVNKIANDLVEPKPQQSHRSKDKLAGGKQMENKGKPLLNGNSYARELKEMPDHSNEATRATENRLGAFIFDRIESPRSEEIIDRGPYEMDNGAIYQG
jgi:hypothetical protein